MLVVIPIKSVEMESVTAYDTTQKLMAFSL